MRQLYTSPRSENIDKIVALLAEKGIECTVTNRSNWKKPTYQRFSYTERRESRDSWPQVWVTRADDFSEARNVLRDMGIEPAVRHAEELAEARGANPEARRESVANRTRRIMLLGVAGAFIVLMLRYLGVI